MGHMWCPRGAAVSAHGAATCRALRIYMKAGCSRVPRERAGAGALCCCSELDAQRGLTLRGAAAAAAACGGAAWCGDGGQQRRWRRSGGDAVKRLHQCLLPRGARDAHPPRPLRIGLLQHALVLHRSQCLAASVHAWCESAAEPAAQWLWGGARRLHRRRPKQHLPCPGTALLARLLHELQPTLGQKVLKFCTPFAPRRGV